MGGDTEYHQRLRAARGHALGNSMAAFGDRTWALPATSLQDREQSDSKMRTINSGHIPSQTSPLFSSHPTSAFPTACKAAGRA